MTSWPLALAITVLLAATPGRLAAEDGLRVEGNVTQGGLAIGHVIPRSRVMVAGRPVRVSPEGEFLLGFDRDAPPTVELRIDEPSGTVWLHTLAVASRKFDVQRIDGLPQQQVTPDPQTQRRIQKEASLIAAAKARDSDAPLFRSGFIWPVNGRLSGVYGSQRILNGEPRAPHAGLDISAARGAPVVATADGTVTLVQDDLFFTGKTIMIDHGFGLSSVYAHLDTLAVKLGQAVVKGAAIGTVGASGRATGPHLHWGVSLFDVRLDPALLVPAALPAR